MPDIEITIDKEGKVEIDLVGFNGKGCSLDCEAFAKALGTVESRTKKTEFWQQNTNTKQTIKNK